MSTPANPVHVRYERNASGRARIDLSVAQVRDIYNRFDASVPYPNRNLDPTLVKYLIELATELDPEPFVVWFHLEQPPDDDLVAHARKSLARYFEYRVALEWQVQLYEVRRSLVLFAAGGSLLGAVTWASLRSLHQDSLAISFAIQGLTVASWVLLWESFGAWFLRSMPIRQRLRTYRALAEAEVAFVHESP